jgi:four helix bundle protein
MRDDGSYELSFERLDVYRCSIEFLALIAPVLDALPRGNAVLADQLRRASLSIPLNIAEGAGKVTEADKARFYAIARGSAMESAAILDCCLALHLLDPEQVRVGKALLGRLVAMLTKMTC